MSRGSATKDDRVRAFREVSARLKKALGVHTDTELASELGLARSAFANRAVAGSIPYAEVIDVALRKGLRLDEVFGATERGVASGELPLLGFEERAVIMHFCQRAELVFAAYADADTAALPLVEAKTRADVDKLYPQLPGAERSRISALLRRGLSKGMLVCSLLDATRKCPHSAGRMEKAQELLAEKGRAAVALTKADSL